MSDDRAAAKALHRRLLGLSAPARRFVALAVACGALGAAAVVVQAWGIAAVVGDVADGRAPAWDGALLLVLGAAVARAALAGGTELLGRRAAEHATHELRARIAHKALAGRSGAVPGARRGEIAAAAVEGVDALADYHAKALPALALAAGVPVAVVAVIGWRAPVVGALLAVTIPVVVVFMVLVGRASAEHARERRHATAVLGAHFLEVVRGLPTLRANGREDAQVATLAAVSERHRAESMGALRVAFLSAYVLEFLAMLGTAIAAATVGVLLAEGHMELETGLFVLLLAPEVYAPLRTAGQRFHAAEDGATAAARVLAFLDEPEPRRPADGRALPAPDPATSALRLSGATVAGGAGRPAALAPLDVVLPAGRTVALVGPSGVGKSTVLALLGRLRDPDDGAVACGTTDLGDVPVDAWWARVAWLPQRPGLPAGRLDEALVDGSARDGAGAAERLGRWLDAVGVGPVLATMPDGLATVVGPGGRPLSAGQTQRLALAGVLASRAPLLLLDEPTAHLDAAASVRATDAILAAAPGRTVVVATHDAQLAARCDVVVDLGAERRAATAAEDRGVGATVVPPAPRAAAPGPPAAAPGAPPTPAWRPVAFAVLGAVAALAVLATSGWLVTRAAERPPVLALLCAIVVVRALGLVRAHARYAERLSSHARALGELGDTRVRWYRRIARRVGAPGVPGSADLLTRFTTDVDELQHQGPRVVLPRVAAAVGGALAVLGAAAVLPAAGLALGAGLLVAGVAAPAVAGRMARGALGPQGAARAELARDLDDALAHGAELAVRGRGPERERGLVGASRTLGRLDRRHARAAAVGQAAVTLATGLTVALVLLLGAEAAADGALSLVLLGALVLLALGAGDLALPLPEAAMRAVAIDRARARLAAVVDGPPLLADAPEHPVPLPSAGALEASGIRHRPGGPGTPLVLDDVALTLQPGERVALIGPSGAGKSTLATLLARLADADEGDVRLGGVPLADADPGDVRAHVRLAGQDAHLFATSVRENVRIGAPDADDARIEAALRTAGLGRWLDALPAGLDTLVGEDGVAVSGGERQRLGLARAVASPADVLLLDEPTAMLDPPTAAAVLDDVLRATAGRTVLVVTHAGEGLDAFGRVLELRGGRLHEVGRSAHATVGPGHHRDRPGTLSAL
ncbi:thiol reductant ABC exporter subunit CydD [Patulibacter americanus]|uniref:thiol reductant ABC exporter subunit CydD n=1 Tax=Patulibacter americanus TaxID=588672 RepID=UPI0003B6515A|nr:thiol reductant ABC exporter subunit CydD [Patulibacter americanus]